MGILLTPVVLVLILVGLLYLPPVQQWVVQKVCAYASEKTAMDIRLERIRLTPLLDLDLQELSATTPPDTILALRHVIVDLDFSPILQGRLGVDAIDLQDGVVNTRDLIATVIIQGRLGNFHLRADDIQLKEQLVELTAAQLEDCDVDIALRDTTVIDTTESAPIRWRFNLGEIEARRTRVAFHTVGDSICIRGSVSELCIKGGDMNLAEGIYKVDKLLIRADSLHYDKTYEPTMEGLDYNHLAFQPINIDVEHLYYKQEGNNLSLNIKECAGREKCGLEVNSLTGNVLLDDNHIQVPNLNLITTASQVSGKVNLDWSALTTGQRGQMDTDINASIGKRDLMALARRYLTKEQATLVPEDAITLSATAHGNVDSMQVEKCRLMVAPMIDAQVQGLVTNVLNIPPPWEGDGETIAGKLQWDVQTFDLTPVKKYLGLDKSIRLPKMNLTGKTDMQGSRLTADMRLTEGRGTALVRGNYDLRADTYDANLNVRNLNLHDFLPQDSLYNLTAKAHIHGKGTDLLSKHTRAVADVEIEHFRYGKNNLEDIHLVAKTENGNGNINLYSNNDILHIDACANMAFDKKASDIDFSFSLSHIDLHALGITEKPLSLSMLMQMEGNTNLKDTHELNGHIKAIELNVPEGRFYPTDIDLALRMSPDTLDAKVTSGDFDMQLASREGINLALEKVKQFYTEVERQITIHNIEQDTLKSMLPTLTLRLKSGNNNTVAKIIETTGYTFNRLRLDLDSSPETGLSGQGYLHALNTGSIMLDTIQWRIYQDTTNVVNLAARVKNGPKNKQVVFESNLTSRLTPTGADANLSFFDAKGKKGVDLGAQLALEDDGYRFHLYPLNPIIAYRRFTLNEDNYIYLHDDKRVEALVDLLADDGTGFKLYSTPNEEALQDITLSIHDFNLGELSAVIPYMPNIEGLLAGDFHLVQDEQSMSVLIDANVRNMAYEGAKMGNIGLNAVYLPNNDGTHYVDGIVTQNGNEVMLLAGTYNPEGEGSIDAEATLQRLPLTLANGFIPDQTIALDGYVTGGMSVKGQVGNPILDGHIATDSMYLNSDMYSLHLRFPNDTIGIKQSNLDFNRIEAYSTGKRPLVLDGTVNFRDLDRIALNLSLSAKDFELINAPKNHRAVAYGKVYVDIGARLTGTLNDMLLRGKLNVLGNTDVTYVLTDSPLTVEDQLAELVTFVDFADSTEVSEVEKVSPKNIDMLMDISIEQAAQLHCLLSIDGTNYVNVEGGGDLTMTYTTQDGMRLQGRYTIVSGMMNYTLMVMSLKNFAIQNGSYVEFTGDILNPRLSISASERVKTTVYENNVPHSVNFDVGLAVSQTLDNMGLEFTLEAPSDMTVSNQLATMSAEERGKVAVTMLATGMYLTESGNGTSGFSATNALNSFLQTQIAAISNKALSTIDLNFGIDNTNTASGGTQTDYNFSFAKRFWGNRISLIIGGKVSSGSEVQNTGESIINNISIEYRMDKSATRYVRLYYDKNTESLLEGEVTEMGAGVVFRRKSTRLGELFLFRKKREIEK